MVFPFVGKLLSSMLLCCCLLFNVPHTVILDTFRLGTARNERVKFDDEFYFISSFVLK